jgi:hypothetical protein
MEIGTSSYSLARGGLNNRIGSTKEPSHGQLNAGNGQR